MSTRHTLIAAFVAAALAVPGLAFGQAAAATTICKDGTTSAVSGRGACSSHGGVDTKATRKAKKDAKAAEKAAAKAEKASKSTAAAASTAAESKEKAAGGMAPAMVTCKDGTMSKGGRGACRGHGGVNKSAGGPSGAATASPSAAPASSPAPAAATTPRSAREAASGMASGKASSRAHEDNNPAGAIAQCKDGLYSHATHREGACSRHGGVAKWMTGGPQ